MYPCFQQQIAFADGSGFFGVVVGGQWWLAPPAVHPDTKGEVNHCRCNTTAIHCALFDKKENLN